MELEGSESSRFPKSVSFSRDCVVQCSKPAWYARTTYGGGGSSKILPRWASMTQSSAICARHLHRKYELHGLGDAVGAFLTTNALLLSTIYRRRQRPEFPLRDPRGLQLPNQAVLNT